MKTMKLRNIVELFFRFKRKNTSILVLAIFIASCNSEDANDCLRTDGKAITYEVELPFFDKIQMENDIRVILKEGPVQNVRVQTGKNLVSDLTIKVEQETLILQNNNGCNLFREYGRTLVKITAPNITFIRQASSFEITSEGTLSFPSLTLWSNTNPNALGIQDPNKSGALNLKLDVDNLVIQANGSSNFQIEGYAHEARVNFSDEFPQFDGHNLIVEDLVISQVSAADMIVHPINSLTGQIRATGDVISVNEPLIVEVEEFFTGRLIFE